MIDIQVITDEVNAIGICWCWVTVMATATWFNEFDQLGSSQESCGFRRLNVDALWKVRWCPSPAIVQHGGAEA